jgi:biopolymer transport protein ExbB
MRIALLIGVLAVVLMVSIPAVGQGDVAADAARESKWFDHFVVKGGWITWILLIPLSAATVALAITHGLSIRRSAVIPEATVQELERLISAKAYAKALELTREDSSVLAHVVGEGLQESVNGYAAMERAVEEAVEERATRMLRKIESLNTIGAISPMIGLFGTVYGMIRLFGSIRAAGALPEPAVIADDISIALVTTFWGLAVAIPALTIFAIFRVRIDVLTAEVALMSDQLLRVFKPGAAAANVAKQAPAPVQRLAPAPNTGQPARAT